MKTTKIKTIPHTEHRYETVGDWFEKDEVLNIRVSDMKNPDYEFLIVLHEFVESFLCARNGVKEKDVDTFDMEFKGEGEPGNCPDAPYYKEHQTATLVEKAMCETLGLDWQEYDKAIENFGIDEGKSDD